MIKIFIELDSQEFQNEDMLKKLIEHHLRQVFFLPIEIRRLDVIRIGENDESN